MTRDMPRAMGASIIVYRLRDRRRREIDGEWVMVRSGLRWRDLHGDRHPDDAILEWAPLVPGERVTR